jgi:hypothetical protein
MLKSAISRLVLIWASLFLVSWGKLGHQAIGYIAQAHLTPKTAQAIKDLLGSETLAEISTYADEIRSDEYFQFSAPWHYINVPAGEHFGQFAQSVIQLSKPNLYRAILHWQQVMADPTSNRSIKIFALKMVVHLIGDAHQPLHVGRTEDLGGNLVKVWFESDSTNLHALWDTKLIEHKGISARDFASYCDIASPEESKIWQADTLLTWLYESNQICNQIEPKDFKENKLGQAYYNQYIGLIRRRIDQAGIRLAGILNQAFDPKAEDHHTH